MARLILKHEGINLNSYTLDKPEITLGRNSDNDIHVDDFAISGVHAVITQEDNPYLDAHSDFYLQDQNSTNGTFVNEVRIDRYLLKHGDVITVGNHEFTFDSGHHPEHERTAIYLPDDES